MDIHPLTAQDATAPVVAALRASLAGFLPDYSATLALAKPPVLDQVLLASSASSGEVVLYNDTDPLNKAGNVLNTTDALFDFLQAQAQLGSSGSGSRRVLRSELAGGQAAEGSSSSSSSSLRQLSVALQSRPVPANATLNLQFNVLTADKSSAEALGVALAEAIASFAQARALQQRSSTWGSLLGSLKQALVASNKTHLANALQVQASSRVVLLTYTRFTWAVLLEWLLRHKFAVLGGGCALLLGSLLLLWLRRVLGVRRAAARLAARKEQLRKLAALRAPILYARARRHWRRVGLVVRAAVRLALLLKELKQRRADRAAMEGYQRVAAAQQQAAAAAAGREEGGSGAGGGDAGSAFTASTLAPAFHTAATSAFLPKLSSYAPRLVGATTKFARAAAASLLGGRRPGGKGARPGSNGAGGAAVPLKEASRSGIALAEAVLQFRSGGSGQSLRQLPQLLSRPTALLQARSPYGVGGTVSPAGSVGPPASAGSPGSPLAQRQKGSSRSTSPTAFSVAPAPESLEF